MAQFQTDEQIRQTMRGFDGVWRRVTADTQPAAAAASTGEGTLRKLILNEQDTVTFNACLTRMLRGSARTALFSQTDEARRRLRRLRAEYFIRTGDRCVPERGDVPTEGCLSSLRTAYERALRAAESYERAAERTSSGELREFYRCCAEESRCAAQTLRRLIVNSF